jgi:hypothetical protein
MGSNKTFQQKHGERVMLGESSEFRRLRHAVEKAAGDRERRSATSAACTCEGARCAACRPGGAILRWRLEGRSLWPGQPASHSREDFRGDSK